MNTLQRPLDAIADQMEPTQKVVYKTVDNRSLNLHIFNPEGHQATDTRVVFITFHGGGWVNRDARYFYPFVDHFAKKGMVGISVGYRLHDKKAGISVFDCVKDARSAVRYVRKHARELGINPNKIIVSGGSAGAHLAAGTALFDDVNETTDDLTVSTTPNLLVLYYPVIDTSVDGYGNEKIGDRWKELSPVDQVHSSMPPTLVLHGTGDEITPYAGAKQFEQNMLEADNQCQLISVEGGRHGYFIFDL
ncbi:MAG: alpha/beta hydrolase, partial [Opitutales bacterium]|nr:alpha/beta hydrolase [Opitutales bacterium]